MVGHRSTPTPSRLLSQGHRARRYDGGKDGVVGVVCVLYL